jgi:hypothetical protein
MSQSLSTDYNFNVYVTGGNNANHFTRFGLIKDSGLLGHDTVTGQVFWRTTVFSSSEWSGPNTMETVRPVTKHHNPPDFNLHHHCCKNLKSHILSTIHSLTHLSTNGFLQNSHNIPGPIYITNSYDPPPIVTISSPHGTLTFRHRNLAFKF